MKKFSEHDELARTTPRRVVVNTLKRQRRLGQYAVVWRDGQTVGLAPEEIGIPERFRYETPVRTTRVRNEHRR